MSQLAPSFEEQLYERIAAILDEARSRVARTVNTAMVHAYWLIGREIVEVEQQGEERAAYGEELIKHLSVRLAKRFGKGFSAPNLRNMRQFFLTFPEGSAVPEDLGGPRKRGCGLEFRPASRFARHCLANLPERRCSLPSWHGLTMPS